MVELNAQETNILGMAMQCLNGKPDIDYPKLSQMAGHTNVQSTKNRVAAILKKLSHDPQGKKRSAEDELAQDAGDKTPKPKAARKTATKPSKPDNNVDGDTTEPAENGNERPPKPKPGRKPGPKPSKADNNADGEANGSTPDDSENTSKPKGRKTPSKPIKTEINSDAEADELQTAKKSAPKINKGDSNAETEEAATKKNGGDKGEAEKAKPTPKKAAKEKSATPAPNEGRRSGRSSRAGSAAPGAPLAQKAGGIMKDIKEEEEDEEVAI